MNLVDTSKPMNIVIIGAGPRGLATALYAAHKGLSVTLLDPEPLHTWKPPSMVPDLVMRSPLTFDLTTFCEEIQKYSLCTFLGNPIPFSNNQRDIEYYPTFPTREEFVKYLDFIYRDLLRTPGVSIIKEEVKSIHHNTIITNTNRSINATHIVLAPGNTYASPNSPNWIKLSQLNQRVISTREVITAPPKGECIAVVGSGQGSSELVNMMAGLGNRVYWCTNKPFKVTQYPTPSYSVWGGKTALGSYYRLLRKPEEQMRYLGEVKTWQPSITPRIARQIEAKDSNITIINPTSTTDLEPIFKEVNKIIVSAGSESKLSLIPFREFPQFNPYFPNMPLLTQGFKSSIPNVYFTGLLAVSYDGPRQGSIISAALTAKEIIESILNA